MNVIELATPGYYLAIPLSTHRNLPQAVSVIYVDPIDTSGKSVDKTGNDRHND